VQEAEAKRAAQGAAATEEEGDAGEEEEEDEGEEEEGEEEEGEEDEYEDDEHEGEGEEDEDDEEDEGDEEGEDEGAQVVRRPGLLLDTATAFPPDLVASIERNIQLTKDLLPGVADLARAPRPEMEEWREGVKELEAALKQVRGNIQLRVRGGKIVDRKHAEEELRRGKAVLRAYDAMAGLFAEMKARQERANRLLGINMRVTKTPGGN